MANTEAPPPRVQIEPMDALLWAVLGGLVVYLGKRGVVMLLGTMGATLVGARVIPRFAASQLPALIEKGLRDEDEQFTLADRLIRVAVFWTLDLGEKRFTPPGTASG